MQRAEGVAAARRTSASSTATETPRRSRARSARRAASSSRAPGIQLNNMLGEPQLLAGETRAGERVTSLMTPALLLHEGRPRLVLGSAGSSRLHGAIMQVVANVAARGLGVEEAVEAPRIHLQNGVAHCEDPAAADELEAAGYPVVRWRAQNLFFGGVSAVEIRDDGTLAGAGDPRRGGAAVVVEA